MKGGLLAGLYAVRALAQAGPLPFERLTFVANPDEEIGSLSSTPHIAELAADADACLVLECARANGDIVSSRKGIVDARITVHGRAAHAGVEPEKGRNAILAAADLVRRLHDLNGRWDGVTVNVGVVNGGTRPNVVAGAMRAPGRHPGGPAGGPRGGRGRDPLAPRRPCPCPRRPPSSARWPAGGRWRSSSGPAASSSHATALAGRLGFPLADTATGGASDANTTSGMGIPSLDGLGPDRRQRPLAGGVPGGRLDRAPDDARRRPAARDRPRPGRARLARR